jgi:putative restriction endonuclease
MGFGVFLHRADSIYDDRPAERYQFPKQYFGRASTFISDWVLYYEPRRGGGRGYYAMAKVERIVPDLIVQGMYVALIEPGSYLKFENAVPFSDADGLVERGLLNNLGAISGRAQAAVRPISSADFNRILDRAFDDDTSLLPRLGDPSTILSVHEERLPFTYEVERDRIAYLTSRPVRDRVFRKFVLEAYDCRCALTGLKLINGGGRAEVEAAHIRPVEHNGPDTLGNGIALSGTVHWMFDRGLVSLSDDLDILVSRQVNDIGNVWSLMNRDRKARLPIVEGAKPNPVFTRWHRENCFKL